MWDTPFHPCFGTRHRYLRYLQLYQTSMHLEVVLFAIVLFILSQVTGVALEPILDAPDGRVSGPMVNNIRLRCQNDDYTVRPYSDFWLNSTEMTLQSLNLPNLSLDSLDEGMIRFTLTPDFEGYFYCGTISTGSSSDALELVGEQMHALLRSCIVL